MDSPTDDASLGRRLIAYVVDAVALGALAGVLAHRSGRSWRRPTLRTAVVAGTLGTIYHVVLEGTRGQTLGKWLAGIAVVGEAGPPCTLRAAGVRTALRVVDWFPIGYITGVGAILLSDRNQRIGDRVAGTVVVRTRPARRPGATAEVDDAMVSPADQGTAVGVE